MKKISRIAAAAAAISIAWSQPVSAFFKEGDLPPPELLIGCITGVCEPREEEWRAKGEVAREEIGDFKEEAGGISASVSRLVRYKTVEFPGEIPQEIGARIRRPGWKTEGVGTLELSGVREAFKDDGQPAAVWQDDFSMVLTFRAYGAETYDLAGKHIPHSEGPPPVDGYEDELLGLIGASPADHRITEVEWMGDPYLDDYGIAYRNARASGERRLADYWAEYNGRIYFLREPDADPAGEGALQETKELPAEEETADCLPQSEAAGENWEDGLPQEPAEGSEEQGGPRDFAAESAERKAVPEKKEEKTGRALFALKQMGTAAVRQAKEAARIFREQAGEAQQWIYRKTSLWIPWQTLMGGGLTAALLLCAARRKRKYFL